MFSISLFRTYYPWPNDAMCENFTTVFSKGQPLPPVALASNPNSGNTWLRYLIEGITGIFTGSFYSDIDLSRKGKNRSLESVTILKELY